MEITIRPLGSLPGVSQLAVVVAVIAGVVQGVVEWLPISSQGNLAVVLTALGTDPAAALRLALFLQVGTTLSAASYYWRDLLGVLQTVPSWRPDSAYETEHALLSYLGVATLATGLVGVPLYLFVIDLASALTGGAFVAAIGVLLILTGLLQLASDATDAGRRDQPGLFDSLLVGAVQGVAILPGVSRSGVTAGALLFRRYEPPAAFRLSFILSIPASLGAAAITMVDAGGVPAISPTTALVALGVSTVVGYLTIDAIMRVVDRIPFWAVCVGLGGLAVLGGGAVALA